MCYVGKTGDKSKQTRRAKLNARVVAASFLIGKKSVTPTYHQNFQSILLLLVTYLTPETQCGDRLLPPTAITPVCIYSLILRTCACICNPPTKRLCTPFKPKPIPQPLKHPKLQAFKYSEVHHGVDIN